MFEQFDSGKNALDNDIAFGMLDELQKNTSDEIRRQRTHFRLQIKARVFLLPGNASEILKFKLQGVLGDISEGGCQVLFPMPVGVGDLFRLDFDRSVLDVPLTFSRCLRCRHLREDAYECGFRFFTPISLPEETCAKAESK